MTTRTAPTADGPTPREIFAAALHTAAEMIRLGTLPLPTDMDMWVHDISKNDLLMFADRAQVPVELRRRKDTDAAYMRDNATVKLSPKHTGLHATTVYLYTNDTSDRDVEDYAEHNRACLTTDAPDA